MRYQVYTKKDEKYYFKLKAKNGWPLLSSGPHETKREILGTIDSVRRNASDDDQYERKIAKNGKHYFQVRGDKDTTLAVSRMYTRRSSMNNAIRRVKEIAPKAVVVEKQPVFKVKKAVKISKEEV